jgi:K+-transporting ATPase ATPase A chain
MSASAGSFAGLDANTDWYNSVLGVVMLAGCFLPMVAILAVAGSVGGLTYLPALVLGPIAEHLAS